MAGGSRLGCAPKTLFAVCGVGLLIVIFMTVRLDSRDVTPYQCNPIAPRCNTTVEKVIEQLPCTGTILADGLCWKERADPFVGAYAMRPLSEALSKMDDTAGHDYGRRKEVATFAAKIIERDRLNPEVLRPKEPKNKALVSLLRERRAYFVYWNEGVDKSKHEIISVIANITRKAIPLQNKREWSKLELILLDDSSIRDYVDFPDHFLQKQGKYTPIYFSDLLRLELLIAYGGFWADSTYLFEKAIPRDVYDADLFFFKIWRRPGLLSSWLLNVKKPNNPFLLWMRHLMYEYWLDHDKYHYFDFHYFFEAIYELIPEMRPYYDYAPFHSSQRGFALHQYLDKKDAAFKRDEYLKTKKNAHWGYKLSYKYTCPFLDDLKHQAETLSELEDYTWHIK